MGCSSILAGALKSSRFYVEKVIVASVWIRKLVVIQFSASDRTNSLVERMIYEAPRIKIGIPPSKGES